MPTTPLAHMVRGLSILHLLLAVVANFAIADSVPGGIPGILRGGQLTPTLRCEAIVKRNWTALGNVLPGDSTIEHVVDAVFLSKIQPLLSTNETEQAAAKVIFTKYP
jgi:hypothetical protein